MPLPEQLSILTNNWSWIHFLVLGWFLGSSLGLWAYRDLWYALATFFSGPVNTRSWFSAFRQVLAALMLALPAGLTVVLMYTTPLVYPRIDRPEQRYLVVSLALGESGA